MDARVVRNRVFQEKTAFEPLKLLKNPVSLIFMRPGLYLSKTNSKGDRL
jgi:hypothetical protein